MVFSRKNFLRQKRKNKIRTRVSGTSECPRLSVYRSNIALYAQMIDDTTGKTLFAVSSVKEKKKNVETAQKIGKEIAKQALGKQVITCVFDRNGYKFHGKVKAIADSAREAGLKF